MSDRLKLAFWAVTISFVGSLPLGTLNLGVVSYVLRHNLAGACYFSVAAIAVEMVMVRVALIALKKMERLKRFQILLSITACLLLTGFAVNLLAPANTTPQSAAVVPPVQLHPLIAGLLFSLANPLHLPFWMGWTAVLKSRSILDDNRSSYNTFVLAIGTGTALAFMVYGAAGGYLTELLGQHREWVNRIIGITLLITALMQLYKTYLGWKKKALVSPDPGVKEKVFVKV